MWNYTAKIRPFLDLLPHPSADIHSYMQEYAH